MMSTGARPLVLINALAVEMSPTGEEIIAGIKDDVFRGWARGRPSDHRQYRRECSDQRNRHGADR